MKDKSHKKWVRLDNASRIFPATCNNQDTKVFRLSCELKDDVEPNVLQEALDRTVRVFPHYNSVMRRGVFWYYLEESDLKPIVEKETTPVCAPLYVHEERNLLFRVMYYRRRISLEIFHALTDGTGGIWFMQVLTYYYLLLRYPYLQRLNIPMPVQSSLAEKMVDSYSQFLLPKEENAEPKAEEGEALTRFEPDVEQSGRPRLNWFSRKIGTKGAVYLPPHNALQHVENEAAEASEADGEFCRGSECAEILFSKKGAQEAAPDFGSVTGLDTGNEQEKPKKIDVNDIPGEETLSAVSESGQDSIEDGADEAGEVNDDSQFTEEAEAESTLRSAPDLNAAVLNHSHEAEHAAVEEAESTILSDDFNEVEEAELDAPKAKKAYRIKGRPDENLRLTVIEGSMSLRELKELAYRYGVTLTVFQVALFIYSIGMDMPGGQSKYPIAVSVPVDLRQRFPSRTARNFFGTIMIRYHWRQVPVFENLVREVAKQFQQELEPDSLRRLLKKQSRLSHNPLVRIIPINVKDYFLRLAHRWQDRKVTAAVSSVGKIEVAPEMSDNIYQFGVLTSVRRPQFCSVSFGDQMVITFSSPYTDTEIQRHFFNFLTKWGVGVTISSNINRKPDQSSLTVLDGSIADASINLEEGLYAEIL